MIKTELKDRVLWFDGQMEISPSKIHDYLHDMDIVDINKLCVTHITPEVKQYNRLASLDQQLKTKTQLNDLDHSWNIPEDFKSMNVIDHIVDKFEETLKQQYYTDEEIEIRTIRIRTEYREFKRLGLVPLLRTLIYVINTFNNDDVVWGPGRGSSVSSYVLYLIGVHDVDSVLYDLNISDFMKDIE